MRHSQHINAVKSHRASTQPSILVVAAARNELAALPPLERYANAGMHLAISLPPSGGDSVGAVALAVAMMRAATQRHFDYAINVGFCGTRDPSLRVGENVLVSHDTFFDYGIMRPSGFVPLSETPFPTPHTDHNGWLTATSPFLLPLAPSSLPRRRGYTVSHPSAGEKLSSYGRSFPLDSMETMEGAAFAYVASELAIPALTIRTVSNYCALGDTAQWDIPTAQQGVRKALAEALQIVKFHANVQNEK